MSEENNILESKNNPEQIEGVKEVTNQHELPTKEIPLLEKVKAQEEKIEARLKQIEEANNELAKIRADLGIPDPNEDSSSVARLKELLKNEERELELLKAGRDVEDIDQGNKSRAEESKKEESLEQVNFRIKKINSLYQELSMSLNRHRFPRIQSELSSGGRIEMDENGNFKGLSNNLSELQLQINRIDLPEGQARLSLEAHGFRSVIEAIENLRAEVLKLKSDLNKTNNFTGDAEKVVRTLERKREVLLNLLSALQRYRGR